MSDDLWKRAAPNAPLTDRLENPPYPHSPVQLRLEAKARIEALEAENERLRALTEWQDISTAPRDGTPHTRGVWVHSAENGERLYFEANTGFLDEDNNFTDGNGSDFGWHADDYTHWQPLEPPK